MNLLSKISFFLLFAFIALSCADNNPQESTQSTAERIFIHNGVLDSLVGTCSTFLVRTFPLDTLDLRDYERIRFERQSSTDGDLSGISLYYINSDTAVNIINLQGLSAINNNSVIEIPSPKNKTLYYIRMRLNASVCTGNLYHLLLRNPAVYGVRN